MPTELIDQLKELREKKQAEIDAVFEQITKRSADDKISDEEIETRKSEDASLSALVDDAKALDARIAEVAYITESRAKASDGIPRVKITSQPKTYRKDNRYQVSYFRDLARSALLGDMEARKRIDTHGKEMKDHLAKNRNAFTGADEVDASDKLKREFGENAFLEKRVNPNETPGEGGEFVPPLWLIEDFIPFLRAGRQFANAVRQMDLPTGTDSINIPKISGGSSVAPQTAQNAAISETDITTSSVSSSVITIAGQEDVSMQLLEQSPIALSDEVIFPDLLSAYNQQVDLQALNGSGSAGQVTGILNVSGINSVTYTSASPTGPAMYPYFGQAASQIQRKRFAPMTAFFVTPQRWFWLATQVDGNNRPLVVPEESGPFNLLALQTGQAAEGPVGRMLGYPVIVDANIPDDLGAGTNQDAVIAARTSDIFLFEGALRTRVLQEILSGTLQVRFQLYNYFAFIGNRFPVSISELTGTGLISPSGF